MPGLVDIETTVAGEQHWVLAIELQVFGMRQEHRDFRPIFGRVPNLLDFILRAIDRQLELRPDRLLARGNVIAIDGGRNME